MNLRAKTLSAMRVWQTFGTTELLKIPFRKISKLKYLIYDKEKSLQSFQDLISFTVPSLEFLSKCGTNHVSREIVDSYTTYLEDFKFRTSIPRSGFFGEIYDLGPGLGFLLFVLIDKEKPKTVIETGIAAGASSNLILDRLNQIRHGRLVSLDITSKVGELVDEKLKEKWTIEILPKLFKRKSFINILESYPDASIFLHDSDHSVKWQIFEICSVIKYIPTIKHILVDDVNREFQSFVLANLTEWNLVVIDEGPKISGYLSRI